MADGKKDQLGNMKEFVENEIKMAGQAIREFDGETFSEWCAERGLFTDRAIGGYLRAMKVMAERIGSAMTASDARSSAQ